MARLDRAFTASGNSTARPYAMLSKLAGTLFLIELFIVATLHTLFWTNLGSTFLHRVWVTAPS